MRLKRQIICIVCPMGCMVSVQSEGRRIRRLVGARCARGRRYARKETLAPERVLTTTLRVRKGSLPLAPVRSSKPIPKAKLRRCMDRLAQLEVEAPVQAGQVLVRNLLRTGADILATRTVSSGS